MTSIRFCGAGLIIIHAGEHANGSDLGDSDAELLHGFLLVDGCRLHRLKKLVAAHWAGGSARRGVGRGDHT